MGGASGAVATEEHLNHHTHTHTHTHTASSEGVVWSGSQANPIYFGTETLLSSSSRTGTMSSRNSTLPKNSQYHPPTVTTKPSLPPRNGSLAAEVENPYDTIPAERDISPSVQGGYAQLVNSREGQLAPVYEGTTFQASGRYDHLDGRAAENPYVSGPGQPQVTLPRAAPQFTEPEKAKQQDESNLEELKIPVPPSTSHENPYDSLPQSE